MSWTALPSSAYSQLTHTWENRQIQKGKRWIFWTGNIHWSRTSIRAFCIPLFCTTTGLSHWFLFLFFVQSRTTSTWEIPLDTSHSLVAMTFTWDLWELGLNACQKTWLQNVLQEGTLNSWQEWAEGSSLPAKTTTTTTTKKRLIWLRHPGEGSWLRSSSRNYTTFRYGCRCLIAFSRSRFSPPIISVLETSILSRSSDTSKQWSTTHWGWPNPD